MKRILLISFILTYFPNFSIAQCGVGEIEVKVVIDTDGWGYETYWTLTDILTGAVVMQGGQGGVYGNNTTYVNSICVPVNSYLQFEIYDTYGDGIFAPGSYSLYLDGELFASGSNEIGSYASVNVNFSTVCSFTVEALNNLQAHINGTTTLTNSELTQIKNVFVQFPECLVQSESAILLCKSVVEDYDTQVGAIFTTPTTQVGFYENTTVSPGLELERAMFALQQGIFDHVFTSEVYAEFPQHLNGWFFNSCYSFPGYIAPPVDSSISNSVLIRANFEDPKGKNPHYYMNSDETAHALRPTGLYLAPGSIASVTVPASMVGQNYYIRVGSHEHDLTIRGVNYRFVRISKKFPINTTTTEVYNPFGGAISILVPYGANNGIVEISVSNGVETPFFSLKSFYETPDFNAELNKPGPWAVFETDNVMFTIPKHSIIPGQYDIKQSLLDWDKAIRGVNSILARQIIPDKHDMYMIADRDIRYTSYSIGYPLSNTPVDYTIVPGFDYFLNGPGPDDETNFHEHGHSLNISKFAGEEEALVNLPYIMALNYGLGQDLNEAVKYSFVPNVLDMDKTATMRIIANTFGTNRDISDTESDEVRYQHRGYAHYFEIVNLLGWCPLRNFWRQEYIDFTNGIDHGSQFQDNDSRIIRMCVAAQADLRPLFHFFGVVPQNPLAVQNSLNQLGVQPSIAIYNRLQDYFNLIPEDNAAFVNFALLITPNLYIYGPTGDPDYGEGWFYLKSLTYDVSEAQARAAILQSIIDLYFPNGAPTGNVTPNVCCLLDTIQISHVNEEVIVTGGVEPYNISIEITGNIKTVNVVDYDGCESTSQFIINNLSVEDPEAKGIKIYPNPATSHINIDFTENSNQIERLQIVSINGQILKHYQKTDHVIDVSALNEGIYIMRIELVSGEKINKKIVILR